VPFYLPLEQKKNKFVFNLLVIYDTSSIREPPKGMLNVLKLMGKHFIDPKSSEILSIFQVFPCVRRKLKLPFFGQNCSLPFSLRSLVIPALLKSWMKH
jgi:hypothetical protein